VVAVAAAMPQVAVVAVVLSLALPTMSPELFTQLPLVQAAMAAPLSPAVLAVEIALLQA